MKKLLILNSKLDAISFKKSPFNVDEILSLNPAAEAEMLGSGYAVMNTLKNYTNESHIQAANHQLQAVNELTTFLKIQNIDEVTITWIRSLLFYLIPSGYFLYKAIPIFDEYFWYDNAKLKTASSQLEAFKYLFQLHIKSTSAARNFHNFSFLSRFICSTYNLCIAAKFKKRKTTIVMDGGRPVSVRFVSEINTADNQYINFIAKTPGTNLFKTAKQIFRAIKRLKFKQNKIDKKSLIPYFYCTSKTKCKNIQTNNISDNEFRKLAFSILEDFISKCISTSDGYIKAGREYTKSLNPKIMVTDSVSSPQNISAAKWLSENDGKVIMFNHTSHTAQEEKIAKSITNLWAEQGIIYHPYATYNAIRLPKIAELANEVFSGEKIYPLTQNKKIEKTPHQKFNIIFAGNYFPIKDHVPFITETPDEFALSILTLAEAVSKIPEAHLTIKLKIDKPECNQEAIEKLMPKYANVEVKSTGSLKNELAECDLLVANISATIDEALESWTPVLLYSATYRYKHFEGMSIFPDLGRRSAVYAPDREQNLTEFIKAIITAHKDKPLKQIEIAPYIWDESADEMQSFVRKVLKV